MTKKNFIAICLMIVALVAGITWSVLRSREPSYEGRSLSSWMEEYDELPIQTYANSPMPASEMEQNQQAQVKDHEAIAYIGTNAVPTLLKWAKCKDSRLKEVLIAFARKQRLIKLHVLADANYHSMATDGFYVLGSAGRNAVPALLELLQSPDSEIQRCAGDCLGNIGPEAKDAVPILLRSINDTNYLVQWDTIIMLGRIHQQPDIGVPALTNKLNAINNQMVIQAAIRALAAFGKDAKPAVPLLEQFTNGANTALLRIRAEEAIQVINQESTTSK